MTDLTEGLARAAVAAIADIEPQIEAAGPQLQMLTVELEVNSKGAVVGAVAWLQHRVSLGRLFGVGRG